VSRSEEASKPELTYSLTNFYFLCYPKTAKKVSFSEKKEKTPPKRGF
jgi:hypothetical protein